MFTITMEKECSCFKRSNFETEQSFESEEEAFEIATQMAKAMTHEFCKQHAFSVLKEDCNFLILLMS